MATTAIAEMRMVQAHERAMGIVRKHAAEEIVTNLENLDNPNTRQLAHLASYQAQLIAALAEMVDVLMAERESAVTKKGAKKT